MSRRIVYLVSKQPHLPYLVTSLISLRRWWQKEVLVCAWPESYHLVRQIVSDSHINADCLLAEPSYRGKNEQFLHKIQLMQSFDNGPNLYLDADTLIAGDLNHLFAVAEQGFCATQFNDWTTDGSLIKNRISRLLEFDEIEEDLVRQVCSESWPSVNGGVFCCQPSSPVLPLWYEWSFAARNIFICDECVLHLMVPRFEPILLQVASGKYNSSPKFVDWQTPGVCVWHGHGDCFTRPDKSPRGAAMWKHQFELALKEEVGKINRWWPECGNTYLNAMMNNEIATVY